MSARFAGEHSPVYGVGGPLETTIVSPSPWTHCGLCRLAATTGGVGVLPEEHRILEDDL